MGVEDLGVNGRKCVTESWKDNKGVSMHAGLISFRIGVTWFSYAVVRIARRVLFNVVVCFTQLTLCPLITSTHIHTFAPHQLIYLTISCLL